MQWVEGLLVKRANPDNRVGVRPAGYLYPTTSDGLYQQIKHKKLQVGTFCHISPH